MSRTRKLSFTNRPDPESRGLALCERLLRTWRADGGAELTRSERPLERGDVEHRLGSETSAMIYGKRGVSTAAAEPGSGEPLDHRGRIELVGLRDGLRVSAAWFEPGRYESCDGPADGEAYLVLTIQAPSDATVRAVAEQAQAIWG